MNFAKFLGLNNKVSWERQDPVGNKGEEPSHYLDSADNVYLDDSGRVARRDGTTLTVAGASHSLFATGNICLYAQGSSLYRYWEDGTSTLIRSDLSGDPVSYFETGGVIYYSDNTISGLYDPTTDDSDWAVGELGILSPTIGTGELPAGRYGYVATVTDQRGREGGAVNFGVVEVGDGSALQFDVDSGMLGVNLQVNIYATPANGDIYYKVGSVSQPGSVTYFDENMMVLPLDTTHMNQPPVGHVVSHYRGRMLVANGPWLFYSEPYRYHLFAANNYLPFGERVAVVAPVNDGVFVATEKRIYFLAGDSPEKFVLTIKAEYGGIEGTLLYTEAVKIGGFDNVSEQPIAMWSTPNGIVVAGDGGFFVNLTESRYEFGEVSDRGASIITTMGGSNQFITTIQ